jgi:hypothetical protein
MWRNLIAVALVLASFPADAKKGRPFTALACTATISIPFNFKDGAWVRDEALSPLSFFINSISNEAGTAVLLYPGSASAQSLTISHPAGLLTFSTEKTGGEVQFTDVFTVFTGYGSPTKSFPFFHSSIAHANAMAAHIAAAGVCLPIYEAQPAPSPTDIPVQPPDACQNWERSLVPDGVKQAILKDLRNRGLCPTN